MTIAKTYACVRRSVALVLFSFGLHHLALAAPAEGRVTATLRLQSRVTMEELASSVIDPKSNRFGQFYSPQEIRALAAPADADYQALLSNLHARGIRVVGETSTHLWLRVEGEASQLATLAPIHQSHTVLEFRRVGPPPLPFVAAVIGLDKATHLRSRFQSFGTVSKVSAGLRQESMKAAYGFDALYKLGYSGRGQHIAIATFGGLKLSDVREFYATSGISPLPKVDTINFNGTAAYDESPASESELDTEFAGLMAPGANLHVFTSATNDNDGEAQLFTAILDDNRAKIVSYSWGSCEGDASNDHYQEMNRIFARAVAQGVNILVSAGDNGSKCGDLPVHAEWPSVSPYVVSVGGTSFHQGANGFLSETAWACSTGVERCSGGGISEMFPRPSWQIGIQPYAGRAYPDISFNADPQTGEAMYFSDTKGPSWRVVGGTSMATPHWAGLLALLGEARAHEGKHTIGFINPMLYGYKNPHSFNDITVGGNGAYNCAPGWDPVTGFGSPRAEAFVSFFTALP